MKKIMFILFVLLVTSSFLLSACVKQEANSNDEEASKVEETNKLPETEAAVETDENKNGVLKINPDDYYKCVVFELPKEDFRQAAVNHMRAQSSIEWVCSKDFSITEKWAYWGINLEWKQGEKCMGIPYADTKVSLDEFKTYMVDGTFTYGSSKWKEVPGNACMSSIFNSIQQFDPSVAGVSDQLMPSYDTFQAVILGEYTVPKGVKKTKDIIEANDLQVIYECFALGQIGDIVITKNDETSTSHIRMLVEPTTVVRNSAGKINPTRSYVKTIEQTNSFDPLRKDGVKTTWFVDHKYTFEDLIAKEYIPITLEIYNKEKSECEIPYLYLDDEITPSVLAKGAVVGTVKSNFPIRFVKAELLDSEGNLVKEVVVHDMHKTWSLPLRNHLSKLFTGIQNGNYTLVLNAGIAIGNAELARVDFTYNK